MSSGIGTCLLGEGDLQGERVPGKQYVRNDADRFDGMRQAGGRTAGLRLGSPKQRRERKMGKGGWQGGEDARRTSPLTPLLGSGSPHGPGRSPVGYLGGREEKRQVNRS